ncbi:MAG: DUF1361 domain-containing protein [Labilithrix sp.]|nr:DUF1361 domain-containing protein [Labilithrix sp.]
MTSRALLRLALRAGSTSFVQSSALAVALLAARIAWTREAVYGFLLWNLLLAWVPYACAVALRTLHQRGARPALLLPLLLVWLGFLPNAPYLVTDFIHLRWRDGAPLWFDAAMLASYAWAGVGLGAASLRICARIVRARRGPWTAAAFVALSGLATGFGIYLGRFVRLNTWDLATRPLTVLEQSLSPLVHPLEQPRAWVVTLTFGLFFLAAYGVRGEALAADAMRVRASSRTSS